MEANDIVSLAAALVSLAGVIYIAGVRLGKVEFKVDELWNFLMRRAMAEGLTKGVLSRKSPLKISEEAMRAFGDLADRIGAFYHSSNLGRMTMQQACLLIEGKFGDEIVERVCVPLGLNAGACLVAAYHLCQGKSADK